MRAVVICLVGSSLLAPQAFAQAVSPSPAASATGAALTLAEAYHAALQEDATIRAARAAADAKRERLPQARSQLLPNVSASAGVNRNHLLSLLVGKAPDRDARVEVFYGVAGARQRITF